MGRNGKGTGDEEELAGAQEAGIRKQGDSKRKEAWRALRRSDGTPERALSEQERLGWGQVQGHAGSGRKEASPRRPAVLPAPWPGNRARQRPPPCPPGPSPAARGPSGLVLHLPTYGAARPPRSWGPRPASWGGGRQRSCEGQEQTQPARVLPKAQSPV